MQHCSRPHVHFMHTCVFTLVYILHVSLERLAIMPSKSVSARSTVVKIYFEYNICLTSDAGETVNIHMQKGSLINFHL